MIYTTIKEISGNELCCLKKVKQLKTFIGYEANGFTETTPIPLSAVLKSNGLKHTYWVLSLTEKGCHLLKVYSLWNAEKVLPIWEKVCPNDISIRLTIEAAKKAIEEPTDENKKAACISARNAIYTGCVLAAAGVCGAFYIYSAAAYTAYVADDDHYAASYTVCVASFAVEATAHADTATYDEAYKAFEKEQEAELLRLLEEATP